jgi:hypothetical protein
MFVSEIIEDIQGERAISCADFIDLQVLVREILEKIFRSYAASHTLAIPWLEGGV